MFLRKRRRFQPGLAGGFKKKKRRIAFGFVSYSRIPPVGGNLVARTTGHCTDIKGASYPDMYRTFKEHNKGESQRHRTGIAQDTYRTCTGHVPHMYRASTDITDHPPLRVTYTSAQDCLWQVLLASCSVFLFLLTVAGRPTPG